MVISDQIDLVKMVMLTLISTSSVPPNRWAITIEQILFVFDLRLIYEYMSQPATWSRRFLITRRSCKSGWLCKHDSSFSGTSWCWLSGLAIFGVDELPWKVDAAAIDLFLSLLCSWYKGQWSGQSLPFFALQLQEHPQTIVFSRLRHRVFVAGMDSNLTTQNGGRVSDKGREALGGLSNSPLGNTHDLCPLYHEGWLKTYNHQAIPAMT